MSRVITGRSRRGDIVCDDDDDSKRVECDNCCGDGMPFTAEMPIHVEWVEDSVYEEFFCCFGCLARWAEKKALLKKIHNLRIRAKRAEKE